MRDRKNFRRIAAVLMAGAMMAAMSMGVMAEGETTAPKNVTITKQISKEENVYVPATTFQFSIEPGEAVTAKEGSDAIYAGPEGGATFEGGAGSITSVPSPGDIGNTTVTAGSTVITVNPAAFPAPGIYRYNVTETRGDYEGITYTQETKFFDVYVDSELNVYSYTFTDALAEDGKDDGIFTNEYGVGGSEGELNDLTVKKTVGGNQGNQSMNFIFTLTVNGAEGENYYVIFSDGRTPITLVSGVSQTITLAHDQDATIYGLSMGDSYTVKENDYTSEGYTTTIGEETTNEATGTIANDTTIEVVNTKDVTTPTGLVMDIAPYLLMVVAAVVLAVVFLRRRRIAE